jgi:hypothetical protein
MVMGKAEGRIKRKMKALEGKKEHEKLRHAV